MAKHKTATFVFDLETTGLRGNLGVRPQYGPRGARIPITPPRITQFALGRVDKVGSKHKLTTLIGGGSDRGYTSVIQDLAQKHGIVSPQNLPQEFLDDLIRSGMYDPQVRIEGSMLNKQVKRHVKHMLQSGGKVQTAEQQIRLMMNHVDDALTKADSVRLLTYNEGFDIDIMVRELGHTNPDMQKEFVQWLETRKQSGKVTLHGAERGVHQAMFEKMLRDPKYVPEFTRAKSFDLARSKGLQTVGAETLEKHYALNEYVGDIAKIAQRKAAPEQIYAGLSDDLQKIFKGVKGKNGKDLFNEFERIGQILDQNPKLQSELREHYKRVLKTKHGAEVANHIVNFHTFAFTSGWKQELIAEKLLGGAQGAHDAVDDIKMTMDIDRKLMSAKTGAQARSKLADVMSSESYRANMQNLKYQQHLMEHAARKGASKLGSEEVGRVAGKMEAEFTRGASSISRMLGKVKSPKAKIAAAALAGAAIVASGRIARSIRVQNARDAYQQPFRDKLEGLRDPYSSYLIQHGIRPSKYPHGNVSDFGSGRTGFQDPYMGFPMHPDISMARRVFNSPASQRYHAYREAHSNEQLLPNQFQPSAMRDGIIDLSHYIIDMTDADTARLREAWVNRDIPVFGSAMAMVQETALDMIEGLTNKRVVEQIAPSINIRMAGIDAPEFSHSKYSIQQPMAQESKDIAEKLMDAASSVKLQGGKETHGRYIGTFFTKNDRDINRQIVLWGGAMATDQQYMAAQSTARSNHQGIFESQFYHGIFEAQRRGAKIAFSQMSQYQTLSMNNDAAKMYSVGAWSMMANPHMSGITDQYARNQHVMPMMRSEASLPYNMGSLYS